MVNDMKRLYIYISQADNDQYLIAHGVAVEKIGGVRKLRHMFLFKNILVCARQCVSGRYVCVFFSKQSAIIDFYEWVAIA